MKRRGGRGDAHRCLGVRVGMLGTGSDAPLSSSPPCLPFTLLTLAWQRSPPLLPWQSLGDIKGKQEKGYLEERVAKQPLPPTPPPKHCKPKTRSRPATRLAY